MAHSYKTRQFQAGNSQAVRLLADLAFAPRTELVITCEGEKIIVQPVERTMESVPKLFAALKKHVVEGKGLRPKFIEVERKWGKARRKK